ncbi:MAG: hypothetical protein HKN87_22350 [Saprospiraceae bacterium]|nr:hypothetical protein [Saprospiraceae bacterium]
MLHQDFFALDDTFDVILEHTFFCAQHPSQRHRYVTHMFNMLQPWCPHRCII